MITIYRKTRSGEILIALRALLGFAAATLLAACGQSSISKTSDSSPSISAMPEVVLSSSAATVVKGSPVTLKWSTTNAQNCAASGGWSGAQPTSGSLATDPLTTTTTYTLTCTGSGGSSSQSAEVLVTTPAPTVNLAAAPTTVTAGDHAVLTWNSTDATSCTATGGWSGSVGLTGTWSTEALSNTTEFELTCQGDGGSATQSATVTVAAVAPLVTLNANPVSVEDGGASSLSWSANNATSCIASGAWSGTKTLSGSQSSGPLKASATYTLACTGGGGTVTQSVTVSVKSVAPSISLMAVPSSITSGSSSTLSWAAAGATSCAASGGWSGAKATSGSQSTGILKSDQSYTLSCQGPGGTAVQSVTVSVNSAAPTVMLSVGPSAITKGSGATLNWSSTNTIACTASGSWSGSKPVSGSQATGALTANATYVLTCTGPGGTAAQSASVSVSTPAPTVSLAASPSSVTSGSSSSLTWSAENASACTASGGWSGGKAVSGVQSTGALKSTTSYSLTCSGAGGVATQSATVTVSPNTVPTISFSANPSTIANGASSTLTWSASNATQCTAAGSWSGVQAISGSQSTGALKTSTTYSLTCTGAGGSATQTSTVSVTAASPTLSLVTSPSTIKSGAAATLTWSSTNTTSCTAGGAWAGNEPTSGSQTTGALTTNSTYTLTCKGPGGSAAQSATVSVTPAAPTITLAATPSTIKNGAAATLAWSSANATACTASGAWAGTQPISGSHTTGALTSSSTYLLTCSGAGGSASQSVTVTVAAVAPTLAFAASPSTVASGNPSTLSWSATNATACTASGAWSGSKAASGSQSTGTLTASATYGLTCSGAGGSTTQSATVSVTSPAPAVTLSANPTTVKTGSSSTLSWSSTNATSCTASGGWSGSEPTKGSQSTGALSAATKYTITCAGAGGSASQSATVTVSAPAPSVSLSANPSTVSKGGTSTLTWSSTNATSCVASGAWTGSLAGSGTQSTGAINSTAVYTIACTGTGGSATESATVTVSAPVNAGTATLTWSAPTTNTDGTPVIPLTGFHIYYGTNAGALTESVAVSGATTTSYEITGLSAGTWYFAVAADASDGTESAQSSIGSTTI